MSWRTGLGVWVKRQRKKVGLWLCKHCGHKNKRVVGMDWASSGDMIAEADVCQRCDLICVLDVREKPVKVITDMTIEGLALMPDGSVQPRIRVNEEGHLLVNMTDPFSKSGEELLSDALTSGDDWGKDADPKADMTRAIKGEHTFHREALIRGFDPEGKVWSEEERKEMLEAPPPLDLEDFKPVTIRMSKENIELLKASDDKNCIHCGRGLYTVHEQDRGECSRCEKGNAVDDTRERLTNGERIRYDHLMKMYGSVYIKKENGKLSIIEPNISKPEYCNECQQKLVAKYALKSVEPAYFVCPKYDCKLYGVEIKAKEGDANGVLSDNDS